MIFGQDRDELRQMYVDSWRKHSQREVLSPLEAQIAQVVDDHPEYQALLTPEAMANEFTPADGETNPFLHMGLHLAIRDQVSTNRPAGIAAIYGRLLKTSGNPHDAEHAMLDVLAHTLWEAQRNSAAPDEDVYLDRLKKIR